MLLFDDKNLPLWLKGKDNVIALYSAVKCVRNYKGYVFPTKNMGFDPSEIETITDSTLAEIIDKGEILPIDLKVLSITESSKLQKLNILPDIRISELKKLKLYTNIKADVFILLNYKDHLTIYSYAAGASINKAYKNMNSILSKFPDNIFIKDGSGNYLTSSLEYFGSGIKYFSYLTLNSIRNSNKLSELIVFFKQNGFKHKKLFGFSGLNDDIIIVTHKDSLSIKSKDLLKIFEKLISQLDKSYSQCEYSNNKLIDIHSKILKLLEAEFLTFRNFMKTYFLISELIRSKTLKRITISQLNKILFNIIINSPKLIHSSRVKKRFLDSFNKKLIRNFIL